MEDNFKDVLHQIKAIVLDVDGVLTDGSLLLVPGEVPVRKMNVKDGYAMQLAIKKGLKVGVITGGKSESVKERLNKLGIFDVYLGADTKLECFEDFMLTHELQAQNVLYMGDDLPDLEVMKKVGAPTCPKDAAPEIKQIATYQSPKKGGHGCVRDVIEQTLRAQKKWE